MFRRRKSETSSDSFVCDWCKQAVHPLDDLHHYWCHGGSIVLARPQVTGLALTGAVRALASLAST